MIEMLILRGLPGSGKTNFIRTWLEGDARVCSADHFFMVEGEYRFDLTKIAEAHAASQAKCREALVAGQDVIVDNTHACRWEMEPYLRMAAEFGASIHVIDLFDGGCTDAELHARCTHGVPLHTFGAMRRRYEHDWRNGDPRAPWEREES